MIPKKSGIRNGHANGGRCAGTAHDPVLVNQQGIEPFIRGQTLKNLMRGAVCTGAGDAGNHQRQLVDLLDGTL